MGLGIDQNNNGLVDAPPLTITGTTPAAEGVTVNGTLNGTVFLGYIYHIELYNALPDPTGFGEGYHFLGSQDLLYNFSTTTYTWSIANSSGVGCYTATLTLIDIFNQVNASSSEFSANLGTQCFLEYLPQSRR